MKVLFDISHPAHVHFYRHMHTRLGASGADLLVVARDKDVTLRLLDAYEIPHLVVGRSGHTTRLGQFGELVQRDAFLIRHGWRFRPDVVLTRNPAGTHAARAIGAIGVFDTDDGRSAGPHYYAASPFAHVITAPDCLPESFGHRERRYPSYKSLAYLHPSVFRSTGDIRTELGLRSGDRYSVLRLVALEASHDFGARGLDESSRKKLVDVMQTAGPVFISSERQLPPELAHLGLGVSPERMHEVLAEATIVVGDSQTVATEAALLATPSIRINSFASSSPHIVELEKRYGLAFSYLPEELPAAIEQVRRILDDGGAARRWAERREKMLDDKVDLTSWYVDLVTSLAN